MKINWNTVGIIVLVIIAIAGFILFVALIGEDAG